MQQYNRQPQQAQQRYSRPVTQAPVANMMGSKSPAVKSPFVTAKSEQQSPTALHPPMSLAAGAQRPADPFLEKYPYLREAAKHRPAVYQSPYAPGGGFTAAWLPNPDAPFPSHARTLSQDFLMQRSLSQQQQVNTHMRRQSETSEQIQRDKFRSQHEQHQSMQRQSSQTQQSPSPVYSSMPQSISPTYTTMQPSPRGIPTPPYQQYSKQYSPPMSSNPYSYDLSHHPYTREYTNPYAVMHNHPPSQHQPQQRRPSYGLQYQSPQDFQLQMQRESQSGAGGFDHFFKGLQNAAAAGHQRAGSSGANGIGQGQGSPIKSEMGNGGEMLPMMRERF